MYKVYMIRPHALSFIEAMEPFYELIIFSRLEEKLLNSLVTSLEKILNNHIIEA
jgi:hypothetical protein